MMWAFGLALRDRARARFAECLPQCFGALWQAEVAIVSWVCFGVCSFALAATGQVRDDVAQARQTVHTFESRLIQRQWGETGEADSTASEEAVRAFFTEMNNTALRLAAMELLDSRYVYVVSRELAVELLGPLVRDADPAVQKRAVRAIGYNECGGRYHEELIAIVDANPDSDTLVTVAYAMGRSGHQGFVAHLSKLLSNPDSTVRSAASFELTRLAPERSRALNLDLLNDVHPLVRSAALQNLVCCPDVESITALESMLDDHEYAVRERAVWALGQISSAGSADAIAKRLSDADHRVRGRAALVLGLLLATEHAPAVAELLIDDDVVVRRYATQALGKMEQPHYIDSLRLRLNDTDGLVREYAVASIRKLEELSGSR